MNTQPEALRLANFLEMHWCNVDMPEAKAAAELRRQREEIETLKAQRDALLAALKSTGLFLHHCWCDVQMNDYSFEKLNRQMAIVDFAIKAVEEGE